jgi:hypothetical protein
MKIARLIPICLSMVISACSTGNSSDDKDTNLSASSTESVEVLSFNTEQLVSEEDDDLQTVDDDSEKLLAHELLASEEFTFDSTVTLQIDLLVDGFESTRAYVNICRGDEDKNMDYSDCILKQPLKKGGLNTEFTIGQDVEDLYLAIWQYSLDAEVLEATWTKVDNGLNWEVRF